MTTDILCEIARVELRFESETLRQAGIASNEICSRKRDRGDNCNDCADGSDDAFQGKLHDLPKSGITRFPPSCKIAWPAGERRNATKASAKGLFFAGKMK